MVQIIATSRNPKIKTGTDENGYKPMLSSIYYAIISVEKGENKMEQDKCWCNSDNVEWYLWDENHEEVLGLDGKNAMLRVRISPKQGRIGIPIDYCPYCGRKLVAEITPRCPEIEKGNV